MRLFIANKMILLLAVFAVLESEACSETPPPGATPALKTASDLRIQIQSIKATALDVLLNPPADTPDTTATTVKALRTAYIKMFQLSRLPDSTTFTPSCGENVLDPNDRLKEPAPNTTEAALIEIERNTVLLDIMGAKVAERGPDFIEKAEALLENCATVFAGSGPIPNCCTIPNWCGPDYDCSDQPLCKCIRKP